jgi:hypothetical protein
VSTRAVWTGAEILVPTGIRSLELPAISESDLCRLFEIIFNKIEGILAGVHKYQMADQSSD